MASSDIETIKLLIGDTDPSNPDFTDEEYQCFLDIAGGSVYKAAIFAVQSLMMQYARLADEETGEIEVKWSQRARNMRIAADMLKEDLANLALTPVQIALTGASISEVRARDCDEDRVPNVFEVGLDDSRQSGLI